MQREENTKKKRIILILLLTALILLIAYSFAWLATMADRDNADITGNTKYVKTYFESGNGTALDPYIIATPEQLNNLAWLQYFGYFNKVGMSGTIPTTYFKVVPKDGSSTLDMSQHTLPPIGTEKYPFLCNFNGNGVTISGLTVKNTTDVTEYSNPPKILIKEGDNNTVTDAGQIVGLFGVVGGYNSEAYTSSNNKIYNFHISNITVYSQKSKGLAGLAAGYVNGALENIGVVSTGSSNSAIKNSSTSSFSFTSNISDYSLVGYCADEKYLGDKLEKTSTEVAVPSRAESEETEGGWENSINMRKLFKRVEAMDAESSPFMYSATQTIIKKTNGQIEVTEGPATISHSYLRLYEDAYNSLDISTGTFASSIGFATLYGQKNIEITKTVKTVRKTATSSFQIIDGSMYLHTDGTRVIAMPVPEAELEEADAEENTLDNTESDETSENEEAVVDTLDLKLEEVETASASLDESSTDACYWRFEDSTTKSGYLKTTIGSNTYYLNRSGTNLVIGTSGETIWYTADNELMTSDGSTVYYVVYSQTQNKWMLSTERATKYIINNGDHYLAINPSDKSVLMDTIDRSEATKWDVVGNIDEGSFSLKCTIDGTTYYLRNNNGSLQTYTGTGTSGQTTWGYDYENNAIYTDDYYLQYSNGAWSLVSPPIKKTIRHFTGSYYLSVSGTSITSSSKPYTWYYDSNNHLFTYVNGVKYYLYTQNYNLLLKQDDSDRWSFDIDIRSSKGYGFITNQQTKRIRYKDSKWDTYISWITDPYKCYFNGSDPEYIPNAYIQTGNVVSVAKLTIDAEIDPGSEAEETTTVTRPGYYTTPETYIPLLTDQEDSSSFAPDSTNVGYIVSGGQSDTSNSFEDKGDIRLCAEGYIYKELYYSNNHTVNYIGNNRYLQALTRTADSGGFVRIKDAINGDNIDDVDTEKLSAYSYKTVDELGLTRYNQAIANFRDILTNSETKWALTANSQRLYGLHFMNADVGMDNIATIPIAIINGTEYESYQVPRDCINCRISTAGKINMFAGSYYYDMLNSSIYNDSFFSLYQVFRNDNEIITDIKRISEIYEVSKLKYEYKYSDGTTSGSISGAKKVFDMSWLENPGSDMLYSKDSVYARGALYYFEIPVKKGEYAIGSVPGKSAGAYMTYLDVCASNQIKCNVEEIERTRTITEEFRGPKGVDFQASTSDSLTNVSNSASISLAPKSGSASEQTINFSRTGDTISVSTVSGEKCSYKASEDITVQNTDGTALELSGKKTKEVREQIKTETKNNKTTGAVEEQTITKLRTTLDGSGTVTKKEKWIDGVAQPDVTEEVDMKNFTTGLKYRYITAPSTTVSTVMSSKITGTDDDKNVEAVYTITITPSKKLVLYVEELLNKLDGSKINGNTVVKNGKITINP